MNNVKSILFSVIIVATFVVVSGGLSANSSAVSIANDHNCTHTNAQCVADSSNKPQRVLSRHKRYLSFPQGSSFSVAFCSEIGFIGTPSQYVISWQLNWGIAYDLPNDTWIINERERQKHRRILPKQLYQRRNRRELYRKLENAVTSMGYNGRQCIMRALCESSQHFRNKRRSMVEELTFSIFTLPAMKVLPFEHEDLLEYDIAFRKGQAGALCPMVYPNCNLSLIKFALGDYLTKPTMKSKPKSWTKPSFM